MNVEAKKIELKTLEEMYAKAIEDKYSTSSLDIEALAVKIQTLTTEIQNGGKQLLQG